MGCASSKERPKQPKVFHGLRVPSSLAAQEQRSRTDEGTRNCLIIWLHGLGGNGGDQSDWIDIRGQLCLGSNVSYLFPSAPMRKITLGSNMRGWMDVLADPFKLGVLVDKKGTAASIKYVHKLIDEAIDKSALGLVDSSEDIVLAGFSQGGCISLLAGYSYPKKLAGIVCIAPAYSGEPGLGSIVSEGANARTPALVGHGSADQVVFPECSEEVVKQLNAAGMQVEYVTYPAGHETHYTLPMALRSWLSDVLKLGPLVAPEGLPCWHDLTTCSGKADLAGPRAQWLVDHEGLSLRAARLQIMQEFPMSFRTIPSFDGHLDGQAYQLMYSNYTKQAWWRRLGFTVTNG
jgi:predicted esterase